VRSAIARGSVARSWGDHLLAGAYDARVTVHHHRGPEASDAGAARTGQRFCPRCGRELTSLDVEGRALPACSVCDYVAFRDPKVVAVAVVTDSDGAVWLVRRAIEPCVGEWALPGGYVDWDEHPGEAAARECREEMDCEVRVSRLLGVHHAAFVDGGVVVIAYAGTVVGGTPRQGQEVLEVARFAPESLPPLAFSTHRAILAEFVAETRPGDGRRRS